MVKKKVEEDGDVPVPAANDHEVSTGDESTQEKRHLRISQSDSCFLKFLNKDRRAVPSFCDIAVSVRGEVYPAHKVVLAFGSSYFHAKLSENPRLDRMSFDNVDGSTFEHLLNFLYTSEMEVRKNQIPSLSEAACFFDMMEAVNLLAGEAMQNQTLEDGEKEEELPMDDSKSFLSGALKKPQSPRETQCLLCSRTFCYKTSLENHMAKMHNQAEVIETAAPSSSKRMSTRQRRRPSKFESQVIKNPIGMENRGHNVDEGTTSVEDDDDDEDDNDEDDNGEENQHDQSKEREQKETEANLEVETGSRNEENAEGRKEESSSSHVTKDHDASVAQSSGSHVYPEGLAPVIIQSGNKKTLKCPKCDKTFDRIGESLNAVHDDCLQCD